MKKTAFFALLSALVLFACKKQEAAYEIHATIGASEKPAKAFFEFQNDSGQTVVDSVLIEEGKFRFSGKYSAPFSATIAIDHEGTETYSRKLRDRLTLFVEQGKITLTSPDSIKNAEITGSPLNDLSKEYDALVQVFQDEKSALQKEYYSATEEQRKSEEFKQQLDEKWNAIEEKEKAVAYDFLNSHKDSYITLAKALPVYLGHDPEIATYDSVFSLLTPEIRNTALGQRYAKRLDALRATVIGAVAPGFTQNDTIGNPISLSDFKGKYVLVDFWASWCGPCRRENPFVVAAFEKYKDKNFTILGVSLDESKEDWLKAISDDKLAWAQVSDLKGWKNEVAASYAVRSIPSNFLLDPEGKIIEKNLRGEKLTEALEKYLK